MNKISLALDKASKTFGMFRQSGETDAQLRERLQVAYEIQERDNKIKLEARRIPVPDFWVIVDTDYPENSRIDSPF